MNNAIRNFQTISRHASKLAATPSTIKCLADVLKYIKSVLTDDGTITLFQLIEAHLNTKSVLAHQLNLTLLSDQIFSFIYQAFVDSGKYDGERELFTQWLISNPEFYHNEVPIDAELFTVGITHQLAKSWFEKYHIHASNPHHGFLLERIEKMMTHAPIWPVRNITAHLIDKMLYKLAGLITYDNVIGELNEQLNQFPPSYPIVDYVSFPDTAEVSPQGQGELASFLSEYGETESIYIHRKYIDYYVDHLRFVTAGIDDLEYAAALSVIRANVNSSYRKVFSIFGILHQYGFGISAEGSINHTDPIKTLDLFNLVGLTRSAVCLSLVPYQVDDQTFHKLVISFDNYNPEFTEILMDGITNDTPVEFSIAISMNRTEFSVYVVVNDRYGSATFDATNRMWTIDPKFLFIAPQVGPAEAGKTRLSEMRLYGHSLSKADAESIIFGFKQRVPTLG